MYILEILSHSPESCPLGNSEKLEIMMRWFQKMNALAAKHGIKIITVLTDRWGHTSWAMYETPSMAAFLKLELEPEFMARITFNHIEKRVVTSEKETLGFFIDYKKLKSVEN